MNYFSDNDTYEVRTAIWPDGIDLESWPDKVSASQLAEELKDFARFNLLNPNAQGLSTDELREITQYAIERLLGNVNWLSIAEEYIRASNKEVR